MGKFVTALLGVITGFVVAHIVNDSLLVLEPPWPPLLMASRTPTALKGSVPIGSWKLRRFSGAG